MFIAVALTWFAASRVQSPSEATASAAAPEPAVVTHPVQRRALAATVALRGTVVAPDTIEVMPVASARGRMIVTRISVTRGDVVHEGALLAEISGRPLLLAQGSLPAWRDLRSLMEGQDVAQLNAALVRLGFLDPADAGDSFSGATSDAITAWYQKAGYTPPQTVEDLEGVIARADDAVLALADSLRSTRRALQEAQRGPSELDLATTQISLDNAKRDVSDLAEQLATLKAGPTEEVAAERALDAAHRAQEEAIMLTKRKHSDAEAALHLAELALEELLRPAATGDIVDEISSLKRSLVAAESEAMNVRKTEGVMLPAAEIIFVPQAAMTVLEVDVEIGDELEGSIATLSPGHLVVEVFVPSTQQHDLSAGSFGVAMLEDGLGTTIEVVVAEGSGDIVEDPATGTPSRRLFLVPVDPIVAEALSLSVITQFETTRVEDELVVPVSSIYSDANGATFVLNATGGDLVPVAVEILLVADGWVAVKSEALDEQSTVVVSQ